MNQIGDKRSRATGVKAVVCRVPKRATPPKLELSPRWIHRLHEQFDVTAETALEAVGALIEDLIFHKLVILSEPKE
jgi:hypothetical protein